MFRLLPSWRSYPNLVIVLLAYAYDINKRILSIPIHVHVLNLHCRLSLPTRWPMEGGRAPLIASGCKLPRGFLSHSSWLRVYSNPYLMSDQPLSLDTDYSISSQDASLFRRISGIQDDEELKRHLLEVQSEAYAICHCPFKWYDIVIWCHQRSIHIPAFADSTLQGQPQEEHTAIY